VTDAEGLEPDERVGREVDRYEIVRLLGKGGMGAVYEARHLRLGRRVAIKFLLPELAAKADLLRRFENEAVAAGGLEHPNLVAVIDLGRSPEGSPYLVMEFLQGDDCARLLRRVGPLPVTRAVNIVLQACRGVAVAHDAGVVHRDLKPENLFVTDAGDGCDQVKVLDFGIAKLRPVEGQASTRTGSTFGTTHYMSPEQARGASEVDARADVWSLGVVLYELLAGRKPFDGEQPLNIVHQILNAAPPPLDTLRPGLPRGLVAALDKALCKDAGKRCPSVRALAAALAPFAGPSAAPRAPEPALTPTLKTSPPAGEVTAKRRGLGGRLGTVLAVGGVGVVIIAVSLVSTRDTPTVPVALPAPAPSVAPVEPPAKRVTEPLATPPETAKPPAPSEQSEQSGHVDKPVNAARRPRATEGHPKGATPSVPSAGREGAAARALKLDPNPY
jgi:eukaryotic-like serine/threonine-protein kinase